MSEPAVRLHDLRKSFGSGEAAVHAVAGVDLDIVDGEFLTLLGPSGSGKTTVLRMIAGFELPTSGTVTLDGVDVTRKAPFERNVNTVFQDYALFPHMTRDAERRVRPPGQGRRQGRAQGPGQLPPSTACGWGTTARASPGSSPVASGSASPWLGPWSTDPRCSSSTSPSAPSTSSSARRCRSS